MNYYSIKDLERLSGVKAHTLRVWERRYQLLKPERSDTNIRSYGDDDLRKLLNVSVLLQYGWKISKASKLDKEALKTEVVRLQENLSDNKENYLPFINSLLVATLEMDSAHFEKVFASATTRFGLKESMQSIVNPLLRKIGLMWTVWKIHPGQEHFASNLIKQKLFTAINQIVVSNPKSKKFLLFLPEREHHEIGLLLANYLLKSEGYEVINLGQNTPFEALPPVVEAQNSDCILTVFITERPLEELESYYKDLSTTFPKQSIFVAGNSQFLKLANMPTNVKFASSMEDLLAQIEKNPFINAPTTRAEAISSN